MGKAIVASSSSRCVVGNANTKVKYWGLLRDFVSTFDSSFNVSLKRKEKTTNFPVSVLITCKMAVYTTCFSIF